MNRLIVAVFFVIFSAIAFALSLVIVNSFLYDFDFFDDPATSDEAFCSRVVNGDTIVINDGVYVRLIGVNTPETVHPSKPVEQFGKEASEFTRTHLEGKTVYLTYDQNRQDKYGRLLAYVWLPVEFRGETKYVLWNAVLILNGYGNVYTDFAFKEEYMEKFRELECYARKLRLGLWSTSTEPQKAQGSTSTGPQKTQESTPVGSQETEDVKTYNVKIVTIQYKGKDEYIVIQNFGTSPVNLAGWKIFSEGGQWYTFPNITLDPGERISVHSGPEASGTLVWANQYIWNDKGDKATLYDVNGNVVSEYEY